MKPSRPVAGIAAVVIAGLLAACSGGASSPTTTHHASPPTSSTPTTTTPKTSPGPVPPPTRLPGSTPAANRTVGLATSPNYDYGTSGNANVATSTPSYIPLRGDAVWSDLAPLHQSAYYAALVAAGRVGTGHPFLTIADYAPPRYATGTPVNGCIGYNCGARASAASAYARFTAATARACLHVLQIATKCSEELWNEENLAQFWQPDPDPDAYAALVAKACPAVHRVNPDIKVVTGGLSPAGMDPIAYATEMFTWLAAHHIPHCIDAVGFHPYGSNGIELADQLHQVMARFGYGKLQIWATEVGLYHKDATVQMAPAVLKTLIKDWFANPWAGPIYIYTWLDDPAEHIRGFVPDRTHRNAVGNAGMLHVFMAAAKLHDLP